MPDESLVARPLEDPLDLRGRHASSHKSDAPEPEPHTVFVEEAYQESVEQMVQLYREQGFLNAKVELAEVRISVEEKTASVRIKVVEGLQTRIEKDPSKGCR